MFSNDAGGSDGIRGGCDKAAANCDPVGIVCIEGGACITGASENRGRIYVTPPG